VKTFAHKALEGRIVRLEPLAESHHSALCSVGLDSELWRWIPYRVASAVEMLAYIRTALDHQAAGTALPFVTMLRESGQIIGSTRFMNIDAANRRVEIGATWIAQEWQRSAVNTEAKYLMLRHAFETLGCIRVEFKTDALNQRSRRAILRLGAKEEGIFRQHIVTWSGRLRDSVYFSILDSEWPAVKVELERKLV
jgi:RimJ/RimL family protein N-acetyltransferase